MQKPSAADVTRKALEGKTILITRRAEQSDEFVAEIGNRGGKAVVIPLIQISDPESWLSCDGALSGLASFDGIVFTSRNAVDKFFKRIREKKISLPTYIDVYAVGQRTAEAVKKEGTDVAFVPNDFSSAALMEFLSKERVHGKKFLLPGGNLNAPNLEAVLVSRGAAVTSIEVYKNAEPDETTMNDLKSRLCKNEFDVVAFASSSAVSNFARVVSPAVAEGKVRIAAIGPSTKETARKLNFSVDIEARESTASGLVDAIAEFYSDSKT